MMSGNAENRFVCLVFSLCLIGCFKDVTSLECFSCVSRSTANGCQYTSSCGQNEVCMLRRTVNNETQEIHYESKCEDKVACDLELDRYRAILSALSGRKRAIMKQVLAGDVCLIQCCDQDFCNNGCIMPTKQSSGTNTMTSHPPTTMNSIPTNLSSTVSLENMTPIKQRSSSAQTSIDIIIPTKPSKTTIKSTRSTDPIAPTTPSKSPTTERSAVVSSIHDVTTPNIISSRYATSLHTASVKTAETTATTQHPIASTNDLPRTTVPATSIPNTTVTVSTVTLPSSTNGQKTSAKGIQDKTMSITSYTQTSPLTSAIQSASTSTKITQSTTLFTTQKTYTTKPGHSDKTTTSSPKKDCPYGFIEFNNSCYLFGRHEMSFHQAKLFCAGHNSYLIHVDSASENEFLKNHFKAMHRGPVQYWIGITDEITETVWKFYDTGKNATFYDWSPGEPDGTQSFDGNAVADCAVFDPYLDFQWRDEDCSPYQFSEPVCELS